MPTYNEYPTYFNTPIPTPSEEQQKLICRKHRHVGTITRDDSLIQVYYQPWEEAGTASDMLYFEYDGKWYMQSGAQEVTIEDTLSNLLDLYPQDINITDACLLFPHEHNTSGYALESGEETVRLYTETWADYWLGGPNQEARRLELRLA